MGSSTNTTTTNASTTLPADVLSGLSTAVNKSVANSNSSNPVAGLVQGTAQWGNPAQYNATVATQNATSYQPNQVSTGYQPYMVSTGYNPQTVSADSVAQYGSPSVSNADISRFQNPYTSGVIQTSLDELNRQLAQTNQSSAGQAARAGAFGGDRAAIVQSENNRNANQIAAQTISNLNNQGYAQALTAAQAEAARRLQAGTAQGQLDANVGEANQYAGLQGANLNATQERANQGATATAQALDATQERANQSAGLTGANLNLNAAKQLSDIGNTLQSTQQTDLNNQYAAQYRDAMWPQTATNQLVSNIGTLAGASPRTSTSSTTSPGTSTTGQVIGAGTSLAGIYSLLGGSSGISKLFGGTDGTSGAFDTAGGNLSYDASSLGGFGNVESPDLSQYVSQGFDGFARGGAVGYASGGDTSDDDGTYVPISDGVTNTPTDLIAAIWRKRMAEAAQHQPQGDFSVTAQAPQRQAPQAGLGGAAVNPQGSYDDSGYQPASAGPSKEGNLGLAAAAPQSESPVDAALAVNPKDIVNGNLIGVDALDQAGSDALAKPGFGTIPADDPSQVGSFAHAPGAPGAQPQAGLGAAAPAASSQPSPGLAGNRVTNSANPGAPMPQGYSGGPQQPGMPSGDPNSPNYDWSQNKLGMALLSAGLGMMASKSHTALGAVGDGGIAGVKQLDLMQRQQTDAALKSQLYGVRQGAVDVAADRAGTYANAVGERGRHNQVTEGIQQQRANQSFQTSMQKYSRLTGPELQQQVMQDYIKTNTNPDGTAPSMADAWSALKNYTPRNEFERRRLGIAQQNADNGSARVDQGWKRLEETRDFHQWQSQHQVNRDEIGELNNMSLVASNLGKPFDRDSGLQAIRARKERAGPAAGAYTPQQGSTAQPQQQPGAVEHVTSREQMMALPSGTKYTPDGVHVYTRN